MTRPGTKQSHLRTQLAKAPPAIHGLDEISGGGLPRGKPPLVCGGAGCGKMLLAVEFLVRQEARQPIVCPIAQTTAIDK